jgi:hypothetical protein
MKFSLKTKFNIKFPENFKIFNTYPRTNELSPSIAWDALFKLKLRNLSFNS